MNEEDGELYTASDRYVAARSLYALNDIRSCHVWRTDLLHSKSSKRPRVELDQKSTGGPRSKTLPPPDISPKPVPHLIWLPAPMRALAVAHGPHIDIVDLHGASTHLASPSPSYALAATTTNATTTTAPVGPPTNNLGPGTTYLMGAAVSHLSARVEPDVSPSATTSPTTATAADVSPTALAVAAAACSISDLSPGLPSAARLTLSPIIISPATPKRKHFESEVNRFGPRLIRRLTDPSSSSSPVIVSIVLLPDGQHLLAAYGEPRPMLRLWRIVDGCLVWVVEDPVGGHELLHLRGLIYARRPPHRPARHSPGAPQLRQKCGPLTWHAIPPPTVVESAPVMPLACHRALSVVGDQPVEDTLAQPVSLLVAAGFSGNTMPVLVRSGGADAGAGADAVIDFVGFALPGAAATTKTPIDCCKEGIDFVRCTECLTALDSRHVLAHVRSSERVLSTAVLDAHTGRPAIPVSTTFSLSHVLATSICTL